MQVEEKIIPKAHTLSGFDNSSVVTKGEVTLTTFAEGIAKDTKFQVVEMEMAYNMILGRSWIHEMDDVPSTLHQVIKFPSPWGICQIRGDQHTSRAINSVADTSTRSEGQTDVDSRPDTIQEPEENENIKTNIEELEPVVLYAQWPDKKVYVGANLDQGMKGHELLSFLDAYSGYNQIKMDPVDDEKTSGDVSDVSNQNVSGIFRKDYGVKSRKMCIWRYIGKFLGFLVSNRGIKVNPTQIKAIEEIPDILTNKKEVQRNLKTYLSNPPLLAKLKAGEKLLIYLVVSEVAVSAVLVREEQGKQSPIYYVSKSLLDEETRYPQLEKLALALIMASRKLRPYFQCHPIVVVTTYPLRNILHKHELSGRLAKWAIELSEYEIAYQPRTAVKSQVLADFVADFSHGIQLEAEKELQVFNGANPGTWTLFTDGSSNVRGAGLGVVLVPPTGGTIRQAIKCHSITNNEAEYEAMIAGLELARELGISQIIIKSDSQLVVNQILGTYTAREARIQQYLEKVRKLIKQFQDWKIRQIPGDENLEADTLANLASAADVANDANALVIHLFHSVTDPDANEVNFNNLTWDWRNEIVAFLQYGTVPDDKKKACALIRKEVRYCLKQGNLYRKMFGGLLARCLGPAQTKYVMREVHGGHCGNHAGGRSLVRTLIRAGYYWLKMEEEAESFVAKCDKCQRYSNNIHRPAELLHPVIAP
ncbi:uncharacterized protein [Nicotiana sylvestris]|uniref:uncharacterized protein n=1 Tax=Nicotiana sylvestris TaxID=4096 RepID=UPI00388CE91C